MRLYKCCIDYTREGLFGNYGYYSVWRPSKKHDSESAEIKQFLTGSDDDQRFIFSVFDATNPCEVNLIERVGRFLKDSYTPSVAMVLNAPLLSENKWNALNTSIHNSFDAVMNVSKLFPDWALQSEGISAVISGICRPLERPGQGVFGIDYTDVLRFLQNAGNIYIGWGYMPIVCDPESTPHLNEATEAALSMLSAQTGDLRKIRRILFHAEDFDERFSLFELNKIDELICSSVAAEVEDVTLSFQLETNRLNDRPFKPRVLMLASMAESTVKNEFSYKNFSKTNA